MRNTLSLLCLSCTLGLLLAACSQQPAPTATLEPADAPTASKPTPAPVTAAIAPPNASEGATGYRARATALQAKLVPGADPALLQPEVEALMELGAALVPDFVARHPRCADYLDAALKVRTGWRTMDAETIERDYHHDGVLPKLDDAGVCYHMKDLVVHPATVLVLLSAPQPDFAQAQAEIAEVVEHVGFVEKTSQP